MVELSEKDQDRIAVYVTTVISKFNKEQNRGVVPVNMTKVYEEIDKALEEEMESAVEEEMVDDLISPEGDGTGAEDGEGTASSSGGSPPEASGQTSSLTDVVGIDGVSLTYKTSRVDNNYGNTDFFIYEPNPGNNFVTVIFTVKNNTSNAMTCDIASQSLGFSASLGSRVSNVFRTAFGDDLTTFNERLQPGESRDLVILFQFPESATGDLSSLTLTCTKGGVKYPVTL